MQWASIMTFGISTGMNLTIAGIAYEWLQKPYVLAKWVHLTHEAGSGSLIAHPYHSQVW